MLVLVLAGLLLGPCWSSISCARGNDAPVILEADISIVEQNDKEKSKQTDKHDELGNPSQEITLKEKKIKIPWESLGLESIRDKLKKFKPKNLLSAISLKYLYRHLRQLALAEHDRFVGNPYQIEETTAVKLAHAQSVLMQEYVRLLSDPEVMSQIIHSETRAGLADSSRMERFATKDMANLLSPEEAVDFFISELTQQSFFPKDPAEYAKFRELVLKWGAIPIGVIILGNKLDRENLGGQIHLPVFMLPSGYLGLAFTARVDHIGLSLSPRLVGQGEVVLMRFRIKGTVEEKRGKNFTDEARSFETELSEDWSKLLLKRFGLNSRFYYKNRRQENLVEGTREDIHEIGWNVNATAPGHLFGVIPYTNFTAKMSIDTQQNVQSNLLLNHTTPNYVWSVAMTGVFNFKVHEGSFTGQAQISKPFGCGTTSATAGVNVQAATSGIGAGGFVGVTEESRNLSGRFQFSVLDNRGQPVKWQVGIGIAGQLENQKRLDEKYIRHLNSEMRNNITLFQRYEEDFTKSIELLVHKNSPVENFDGFEREYQTLIIPLVFSLLEIGQAIERSRNEYQTMVVDFERKYRIPPLIGDVPSPEELFKMNELIERYRDLKAKGSSNLKSNILFMALAEHVTAD